MLKHGSWSLSFRNPERPCTICLGNGEFVGSMARGCLNQGTITTKDGSRYVLKSENDRQGGAIGYKIMSTGINAKGWDYDNKAKATLRGTFVNGRLTGPDVKECDDDRVKSYVFDEATRPGPHVLIATATTPQPLLPHLGVAHNRAREMIFCAGPFLGNNSSSPYKAYNQVGS